MIKRKALTRYLASLALPWKSLDVSREAWDWGLSHRAEFYIRAHRYFHNALPPSLVAHRDYFSKEHRSCGENALHTLWYLLFIYFRPRKVLEIGIYRGQIISLWALLARHFGLECAVHGLGPMSAAGDATSKYLANLDYERDILTNFAHFSLPPPSLCRAYSTDPAARTLIASEAWDWIYIDGNHDYEVVKQDWEAARQAVRPGGLIIFDDAGCEAGYDCPHFAFIGHPGPSRLTQEIDTTLYPEILAVGHNRVFMRRA